MQKNGFSLASGVPCSYLKPLINCLCSSAELAYVAAPNEGDALAVASGATLAGRRCVVLLQNSGLGNLINPLTSLNLVYRIPMLLLITLRGEPGQKDEPQHEVMGPLTEPLLTTLGIGWDYLPDDIGAFPAALARAIGEMDKQKPFAFVIRKNTFRSFECAQTAAPALEHIATPVRISAGGRCSRHEAVAAIVGSTDPERDLIISTTGFISRQLYALADRPNHFYMAGSMGCASSIGLGLALSCPSKRVIVLDGDGAVLMRMGNLAMNGCYRAKNFFHVVLDNGTYESTGGQATLSPAVNLSAVAAACGYRTVDETASVESISGFIASTGPAFLRLLIQSDSQSNLPRPKQHAMEIKERFMAHIRKD